MTFHTAPTAEALAAARVRLCYQCTAWQRFWGTSDSPKQALIEGDCSHGLQPLTSTGEDCPYWEKGEP